MVPDEDDDEEEQTVTDENKKPTECGDVEMGMVATESNELPVKNEMPPIIEEGRIASKGEWKDCEVAVKEVADVVSSDRTEPSTSDGMHMLFLRNIGTYVHMLLFVLCVSSIAC